VQNNKLAVQLHPSFLHVNDGHRANFGINIPSGIFQPHKYHHVQAIPRGLSICKWIQPDQCKDTILGRPSKPIISKELAEKAALSGIDIHGITGMSLPLVAQRLGVKAPSPYYHFEQMSGAISLFQ
tara:strand:- start:257 stop:634 length:378 start_codon:yes stop_codon:yes gene_type:complete